MMRSLVARLVSALTVVGFSGSAWAQAVASVAGAASATSAEQESDPVVGETTDTAAPTPAQAEPPAADTPTTFEVAAYMGWHNFAAHAQLGKVDVGAGSELLAAVRTGIRLGVLLAERWAIETEVDFCATSRADELSSALVYGLRSHVVYDLRSGGLRPFALMGAAVLVASPSNPSTNATDFAIAGEAGAGVKLNLGAWWGIRAEARGQLQRATNGVALEFAALASLYGDFPSPQREAQLAAESAARNVESDGDGDGLVDSKDRCPAEKGELELFGCTAEDVDGDGLNQFDDQCPRAAGSSEHKGCPVGDRDGDGANDGADKCPEQRGDPANAGCPWPDADRDRVPDKDDKCPDYKGKVRAEGCAPADGDGDGVYDHTDKCNGVKGSVKWHGCPPPDTDGDLINDDLDKCPTRAGPADHAGCPVPDRDGDGVADRLDRCPRVKGRKELRGCPDKDKDGDGLLNLDDKCPDKPGPQDLQGCPDPDHDLDGVPDRFDKCPAKRGHKDLEGCPEPDKDDDGVADRFDKCPDKPARGSKRGDGCPDEVPTEVREFFGVVRAIDFQPGSAVLNVASRPTLDKAAQLVKRFPGFLVEISGHTDNTGNASLNRRISLQRANAVRRYLVGKGAAGKRLVAVGLGPDRPIADNATAEGRAANRRVEFKIIGN